MRTGGYTIQQTLTTEAASVLKHSLTLARRRGHAQVTPLHVAATLLSSRTSLLRRACIKSHPGFSTNYQFAHSLRHHHHHHQNQNHPLQCRALEPCFNVALNRLPTVPGPMFHGQPSLANALVAALKRAQAHQRRGCIEQQQTQQTQTQPQTQQTQLLAVKVELEQLVISILDDPSVSRVMREAGFNSTAVKNCVEDCSAVSSVFYGGGSFVRFFSSPNSSDQQQYHNNINRLHHYQNPKDFNFVNPSFPLWQTPFLNQSLDQNPLLLSSSSSHPHHHYQRLREIDLKLIVDVLQRKKTKKKNPVIVGDSVSFSEGFVSELMAKLERRDIDLTGDLKQTQFVKFQFSPMASKLMRREDVETNINELRKKVLCLTTSGKSVIIFTGDLTWTIKEISNNNNEGSIEISSSYSPLDHLVEEIGKLIAEYNNDDDCEIRRRVWVMGTASFQTYMRCQMRQPSLETLWALHPISVSSSANLGLSLDATSGHEARNMDNVIATKSFSGCNKAEEEDNIIGTVLSCCHECVTSFEREAKALKAKQDKILPAWLQSHYTDNSSQKEEIMRLRRKWNRLCQNLHNQTEQSSLMGINNSYGLPYGSPNESSKSKSLIDTLGLMPNQRATNSIAKFRRQNSCTIEFDLGGNEHEKSESINKAEDDNGNEKITLDLGRSLFRSDSITEARKKINALLKALEGSIPWQTVTMRLIAESLMDCVSKKEDGWIMIEGSDTTATRRLARTVSDSVFGSFESMVHIGLKRKANESKASSETLLACGLENHEKAVFLIEDIELADSCFLKVLADRFEKKRRAKTGNDHRQAIFILTKEDSSIARNRVSVLQIGLEITDQSLGRKRKPESNLTVRENKTFKTGEIENGLRIKKEVFLRQSSFNSSYLDLNIKAEEDEAEKGGEISPISSDLTGEEETEISSSDFLNRIQNRFALNQTREPGIEKAMITAAFREVFPEGEEGGGVRFSVEEKLVEKLSGGNVQNGAFESWLKEVFQKGLLTVKKGGKKDTGVIRMVFGGIVDNKGYGVGVGGYMGTCLPNKVQVSKFE